MVVMRTASQLSMETTTFLVSVKFGIAMFFSVVRQVKKAQEARMWTPRYVWYIVSLSITKGSNVFVYGALVAALWPENRRTPAKVS